MSSVETISWRDDFSRIEHPSKHLSHERTVLTRLCRQFFGAKGMVCCLQDFEDVLPLK